MKIKNKLIISPLFIALGILSKLLLKNGYILIDEEIMNFFAGFFLGVGIGFLIESIWSRFSKKREA
ncbi:hypothetical protein [Marinifilum caeruleilacunae]|jgi:hypothetical protein|uniref:Uncharacterized protein n=1 Tax=Marinifilum caeruleilacunae TaxID=2499076 RepID=A0ABX1WSQ5_9BACT|nr:hypothetical protein [Marinifilum caeruleilacunae]NOU59143.1 hypothetical protein [Marinifilum caeruleilacunae]